MENKVIDLTAAGVTAQIAEVKVDVSSQESITTNITASAPGESVVISTTTEIPTVVGTQDTYTPIVTAVTTDTLQGTSSEIGLNVTLSGYGEEAISNFGNLFVRANPYTNIVTATDSVLFAKTKGFIEQFVTSEEYRFNYAKKLVLVANILEQVVLKNEFYRSFTEGGSDKLYFDRAYAKTGVNYAKPFNSFDIVDETSLILRKRVTETAQIAELKTLLIKPNKVETVLTDYLISKELSKKLNDVANATDDFYGAANLDDDEYAFMIKVLVSELEISQRFSIEYAKPFTSELTSTDLSTLLINPNKVEQVTSSDYTAYLSEFNREFTEIVFSTDDFYGAGTVDDDQYVAFIKVLTLQAEVNDRLAFNVATKLDPQLIISSDTSNYLFDKAVHDQIYPTDDVFGQATIDDDEYAYVIKGIVNTVSTSEQQIYDNQVRRFFVDVPVILDAPALDVAKPVTDDSYTVSDFSTLHTGKGYDDSGYTKDKYSASRYAINGRYFIDVAPTFEFIAGRNETALISELKKVVFSKILLNTTTASEQHSVGFTKLLNSLTTLTDIASRDVIKAKVDSILLGDSKTWILNKGVVDTTVTTTSIPKFVINKTLLSTVLATDDFYGAADIDDEQYASINKVLHDIVSITDDTDILFIPTSLTVDNSTLTDTTKWGINKGVPEVVTTTTTLPYFVAEKKVNSIALAIEERASDVTKPILADNVYSAYNYTNSPDYVVISFLTKDTRSLGIQPLKVETVTATNTKPVFVGIKGLIDTTVPYNTLSFNLSYHLSDTFIATDDFYGAADLDDEQYATFIKVVHDSSVTSNQLKYSVEKVLINTTYANSDYISKSLSKIFVDIINPTDDFYGVADLDDEQYVTLSKVLLSNTRGAYDSFSRDILYNRNYDDVTNTSSIAKYTVGKVLYSEFVNTDSAKLSTIKQLHDAFAPIYKIDKDVSKELRSQAITAYTVAKDFSTLLFANVYSSDTSKVLVGKKFLETTLATTAAPIFVVNKYSPEVVLATEIKLFDVAKQLNNLIASISQSKFALHPNKQVLETTNIATSELKYYIQKVVLDFVYPTDDFYGLADIDDEQYSSVAKVLRDGASASDTFSRVLDQYRDFYEQLNTSAEELKFAADKYLNDAAISSTQTYWYLQTQLSSILNTTDTKYKVVEKAPEKDNYYVASGYYTSIDYAVLSVYATEIPYKTSGKVLLESANITPSLPKFISGKQLSSVASIGHSIIFNRHNHYSSNIISNDTVAKQPSKAAIELINSSDYKVLDITKGETTTINATEYLFGDYSKVSLDTPLITDSAAKDFDRPIARDNIYWTEEYADDILYTVYSVVVTGTLSSDTTKILNDASVYSDILSKYLYINKEDSVITTDTLYTNRNNRLLDTLIATDDFYGAADIDDEEYVTLNKVLKNTTISSDSLIRTADYNRSYTSLATAISVPKLTLVKPVTESIVASTSINIFDIKPKKLETVNTSQIFSKQVLHTLTTQNVVASSTTRLAISKSLQSSIVTSSSTSVKNIQSKKLDTATASQIFSKTLGKTKNETAITSQVFKKTLSKAKNETAVMSETKTANIQDFFLSNFLETGFVGTNLTL